MKRNQILIKRLKGFRRPKYDQKAGLAPATAAYIGEPREFKPWFDLMDFSENHFEEKFNLGIENARDLFSDQHIRWINVTGLHDIALVDKFSDELCLHGLVKEDILHTNQRPKLDEYDDYLYVVVKMLSFDDQENAINSEQLSIVLKGNTIVTFIEDKGDIFDGLRDRIRKGNFKLRRSGADYLLYSLLDTLVDNYFVVLEKIGDKLEDLEVRMLDEAVREDLQELHKSKRDLIYLRKYIWPLREVISSLSKGDSLHLEGNTALYLRDVYDHCIHVIDTLETFQRGFIWAYGCLPQQHQQQDERGDENTHHHFNHIYTAHISSWRVWDELRIHARTQHEEWAYPAVWALMISLAIIMMIWFRKKRWL
jgi:magnesium transporter